MAPIATCFAPRKPKSGNEKQRRAAGRPATAFALVVMMVVMMVMVMMVVPSPNHDAMMVVMVMTDPDRNLGDFGCGLRVETSIVGL